MSGWVVALGPAGPIRHLKVRKRPRLLSCSAAFCLFAALLQLAAAPVPKAEIGHQTVPGGAGAASPASTDHAAVKPDVRAPKPDPLKEAVKALREAKSGGEARSLEARAETLRQKGLDPAVLLLIKHANKGLETLDFRLAQQAISDALVLQPDKAIIRRERAHVRNAAGDFDGAISDLAVALQADPDDVKAWELLAEVERGRHDYAAAVNALDHALALDPKLPDGDKRRKDLELLRDGRPT